MLKGTQQSLIPEVPPYELANPSPRTNHQKQQRRHSRPGHASGWLEERIGNKKRKRPTTSYYYCYEVKSGDGEWQRSRVYVPVACMMQVRKMISDQASVDEILPVIRQKKR